MLVSIGIRILSTPLPPMINRLLYMRLNMKSVYYIVMVFYLMTIHQQQYILDESLKLALLPTG
jgi:hypothetical protein